MFVGVLKVKLYISGPQSLKDKRRILKSLIEKIKNKFNVSIAETGENDSWNNSELGIACVSNESGHADGMMNSVINYIEVQGSVEITDVQTEIVNYRH